MTDSATDGSGKVGQQPITAPNDQFNTIDFFIQQALGKISTVRLVKIMAVENSGNLAPVGFVDVKPMVNLVDGLLGNSMQHDTVFQLPYFRIQGGKNAIIIDPEVGDIGFAVVCDRDISAAKSNKDFANPGSFRRFSMADGLYVGGVLNATPEQYVQFTSTGIKLADKNNNVIETKSGEIDITTLVLRVNGKIEVTGEVYAKSVSLATRVGLSTHGHPAFNTPPTPGT